MANLIYSTGTVSVSVNGTTVTGVSTLWSTNVQQFDTLAIAGYGPVKILAVVDDTHLTIAPWPYALASAVAYNIIQDSVLRFNGAQTTAAIVKLVGDLDADGFYVFVNSSLTAPDPSKGDEGQFARQPSTGKEWQKISGVWTYQGITGNLSYTSVPWAVGTTYSHNVLVPYAGQVWLSLQASNIGNTPNTSPLWWQLFLSGGDAYDVISFDTDRPADNELVLKISFTKTVTFYAGLVDSKANAIVGATNNAVYSYKKNGTQFATLTFASGGQGGTQNGTWASASDTVFGPSDILTAYAPVTRDPTLSGIGSTLSGYR